ncbi:MAG TPA: hypothetical protein DEF51_44510 [Myxococcales bacterium]|nr:hypothetical protein [Myxococcales bacterium]
MQDRGPRRGLTGPRRAGRPTSRLRPTSLLAHQTAELGECDAVAVLERAPSPIGVATTPSWSRRVAVGARGVGKRGGG